jgi:hypothetical protein
MGRATYVLGWLSLIAAVVERIAIMASQGVAERALHHQVLPFNFLELSFLFFLISIASGNCCPKPEPK